MRNKSATKGRPNNIGPWYEALEAEQRAAHQERATRAQWGPKKELPKKADDGPWIWPLDLERYDQSASLTAIEHKRHGYCTYDFFDQCPHRMACAKCAFYQPKKSAAPGLAEAKSNLLRMRQEIPLGESEIAALHDGVSALELLLERLVDVPTPSGPTPKQLRGEVLAQIQKARSDD
jgi:hypothetical protein